MGAKTGRGCSRGHGSEFTAARGDGDHTTWSPTVLLFVTLCSGNLGEQENFGTPLSSWERKRVPPQLTPGGCKVKNKIIHTWCQGPVVIRDS